MEMMEVAELEELYVPQSAAEPVALQLPFDLSFIFFLPTAICATHTGTHTRAHA